MAVDFSNLLSDVYDLFTSLYAPAASNKAYLAFEVVGMPMPIDMFKLSPTDAAPTPAWAVERVSRLANQVPTIHNGSLLRTSATVDGMVQLMLLASEAQSAADMPTLGAIKTTDGGKFGITLGSLDGVPGDSFNPVYADPPNWFDPAATDHWTPYSTAKAQTTTPTTPPATPPVKVLPIHPMVWRIAPAVIQHPGMNMMMDRQTMGIAGAAAASANQTVLPRAVPPMMHLMTSKAMVVNRPVITAVVADMHPAVPPARPALFNLRADQLRTFVRPTPPPPPDPATVQNITTSKLDVAFEYCIVTLERPWLPSTLMLMRNWYLPSYAKGDISNGTGPTDPGIMPAIVTGFVAVRNLAISAQWSGPDVTAIQSSVAVGPFTLTDRTYNASTGTLSCPGVQIIGWFCASLPVLPPLGDPALAPPVVAPPPATQPTTDPATQPATQPTTQPAAAADAGSSAAQPTTPAPPPASPPVDPAAPAAVVPTTQPDPAAPTTDATPTPSPATTPAAT